MREADLPLKVSTPAANGLSPSASILVIDDEAGSRESLEGLLTLEGYAVRMAIDGEQGLRTLEVENFDLVLLGLAPTCQSGIELLPRIQERRPDLPVIIITTHGAEGSVVEAVRTGAENFVRKPWENAKLLADIRSAVARRRAEEENLQLKRTLKQRYNFSNIVGKSEIMLRVFDLVAQVAPSHTTVLIQGESGTGKELIAKAIHANSPRKDKPFVPINTGVMSSELLESTLFGHVEGAFTSAVLPQKGLFELASGGTVFLDEIATMGMETQAKLLRALQERRFMHLGGIQEIQADVRILAATNVDLRQAVREGRFRGDLFHRLNGITVNLPPLRSRREDIPLLASHFLALYANENGMAARRLSADGMRLLVEYEWPGNVRELENSIERGVVLSSGPMIGSDLLPAHITGRCFQNALFEHYSNASLFHILEDIERRIILRELERWNWSQTDAAEQLHIPVSTLNQKIKRLNIEIRKHGRASSY